jgi:hypothetical protein
MLVAMFATAQANLLNNGDFEDGIFVLDDTPDGWSAYYNSTPGSSDLVNWKSGTGAHGGNNYVQIMGWSTTWGSMFQTVSVTENESYAFSLWSKGDGTVDNAGPGAYWLDSLGSSLGTAVYETFTAGATWEFHDYGTIVAPPGATQFSVYLWAATNTTVYYDDVSLTLVPEPFTMSLLGLGGLVLLRRKKA